MEKIIKKKISKSKERERERKKKSGKSLKTTIKLNILLYAI